MEEKDPNNERMSPKVRGRSYFEQQVPKDRQICREQIQVRAEDKVGKGAFGQVYKGYMVTYAKVKKNSAVLTHKNSRTKSLISIGSNSAKVRNTSGNSSIAGVTSEERKMLVDENFDFLAEGDLVAVKTATSLDLKNFEDIQKFIDEALTVINVGRHPNILNVSGVYYPTASAFKENDEIYSSPLICMPFMQNGDLKSYLASFKKSSQLTVQELCQYCLDISRGCAYLHGHKILHRDIAARNILLDSQQKLKLCDFGLSQTADENNYGFIATKENQENMYDENLPIPWLAIEIFNGSPFTDHSDVWSYGITCWEIFTRCRKPYQSLRVSSNDLPDFLAMNYRLRQPIYCPDPLYELFLRCWHPEPSKRPNFEQINESLVKLNDFPDQFGINLNDLYAQLPENPDERIPLTEIKIMPKGQHFMDIEREIVANPSKKIPYNGAPFIYRRKRNISRSEASQSNHKVVESAKFYEVTDYRSVSQKAPRSRHNLIGGSSSQNSFSNHSGGNRPQNTAQYSPGQNNNQQGPIIPDRQPTQSVSSQPNSQISSPVRYSQQDRMRRYSQTRESNISRSLEANPTQSPATNASATPLPQPPIAAPRGRVSSNHTNTNILDSPNRQTTQFDHDGAMNTSPLSTQVIMPTVTSPAARSVKALDYQSSNYGTVTDPQHHHSSSNDQLMPFIRDDTKSRGSRSSVSRDSLAF